MQTRRTVRALGMAALAGALLTARAAAQGGAAWEVASPDGHLTLAVRQEPGTGALSYTVTHAGPGGRSVAIAPSPLGILRDELTFARGLRRVGQSRRAVDESYSLISGKTSRARGRANEITLSFAAPAGERIDLVARAYDDGVAFRYRFPGRDALPHQVRGELTGFNFPDGTAAWLEPYDPPGRYTPAYENSYRKVTRGGTPQTAQPAPAFGQLGAGGGVPSGNEPVAVGWAFPALFQTPGGLWVLLTEAGLTPEYAGTHLEWDAAASGYRIAFPDQGEGRGVGDRFPVSNLPWETSWRVAIVGQALATVVESSLVTHLSPQQFQIDYGWVAPGRSSWSWWSDDDSPRDPAALRSFIDLSADMGWEYSLVDANWNLMPRDTIEAVLAYGRSRGVGMNMWYNSGGPHNDVTEQPRDRLTTRARRREEFAWLRAQGVRGVKVDFWGSDKQERIRHYVELLRDAADFQLTVNTHGSTIPRGWQRMYPNLVGMEAVPGAEQYKFARAYPRLAPSHNVTLALTRNVVGPMDYTPVTFTDSRFPHLTTSAHELALSVVFENPIQHFADRVEAYRSLPDAPRLFLRQLPTAWDETRLLDAFPDSHAVFARRKGADWYVGGINGADAPRPQGVDLSFLGAGSYDLLLIRDGAEPRSFASETRAATRADHIELELPARGGFVMRITPRGSR